MATFPPTPFVCRDGRTLVLRHCAPADAPLFPPFQQAIAEETTHTLQRVGSTPLVADVEAAWANAEEDPSTLYLGAFDGDRLVGQLGFRPIQGAHPWTRGCGHFGMMVRRELWGQGLGRRLVQALAEHARQRGFHRIEATVRTTNARAIALYRGAGFEIEGTRRKAVLIDGEFHDEYYIARLID